MLHSDRNNPTSSNSDPLVNPYSDLSTDSPSSTPVPFARFGDNSNTYNFSSNNQINPNNHINSNLFQNQRNYLQQINPHRQSFQPQTQQKSTSPYDIDTNMYSGIDLDCALLDDPLRKGQSSTNAVQAFFHAPPRNPTSAAAVAAAAVETDPSPLLEPDYYFGDILGEDGVPPQALPSMPSSRQFDEEDANQNGHVHYHSNSNIPVQQGSTDLRLSNEHHQASMNPMYADPSVITDEEISSVQISHPSSPYASVRSPPLVLSEPSQQHLFNGREITMTGTFKKGKMSRSIHEPKIRQSINRMPTSAYHKCSHLQQSNQNNLQISSTINNNNYNNDNTNNNNIHNIHNQTQNQQYDIPGTNNSTSIPTTPTTQVTTPVQGLITGSSSLKQDDVLHTCDDFSMSNSDADANTVIDSPLSGTSTSLSHPDQYENLDCGTRDQVDRLRERISSMPRRKLREYLARYVSLEDVVPLMAVNRDELAGMLGLGVTTWKTFMHSLGVPRWPARALKSQKVKEKKLFEKRGDAEKKGDVAMISKLDRDLVKLKNASMRKKKVLKNNARLRVSNVGIEKKKKHDC